MAKKGNIAKARGNRKEIIKAGLGRRQMLKMGLLTGAGYLIPKGGSSARAQDQCPPGDCSLGPCQLGCSPAIDSFYDWMDPLPIPPVLPERQLTDQGFQPMPPQRCPFHDINPKTGKPYEGRGQYNGILQEGTDCFQFFDQYPPQHYFIQRMRANPAFRITRDPGIPDQTIWGFNQGGLEFDKDPAIFPGPTIVSFYQQPIVVRRYNELPCDNGGFGVPETTTHLHNFHSGTESDGGPCRYFFQGQYFDYYYAMQQAGFASTHQPHGDVNESLSTLWYHDHRDMHTAENVYKGLAGFHFIFSETREYDTGNENTGFKLPSFFDDMGVPLGNNSFDVPLMLTDKLLHNVTKNICFATITGNTGLVGDVYLVNGRYRPFLAVKQRRYRFRILDGGPSRFYTLFLTNPDNPSQPNPIRFWVIANDGNLLPQPVAVDTGLRISVAERYDIIVDFAQIVRDNPGITRLRLENRLLQTCGQGPADSAPLQDPGHDKGQGYLLEFQIGEVVPDNSVDPASMPHFFTLPDKTEMPRIKRCFDFNLAGDSPWAINGQPMNCTVRRFAVQQNTAEHWVLSNNSTPFFPWNHPIHIHLEEHQILSKRKISTNENIPLSPIEMSRKDVVEIHRDEEIKIFMRFRDFVGNDLDPSDYPLHCHNTVHEDHAMMLLWQVLTVGNSNESCP